MKNKTLIDFLLFCLNHPELRFWQSLSVWCDKDITVGGEDPFYWKEKHNDK